MQKLTVSKETFLEIIAGIVASGVYFKSEENPLGSIDIIFTGGY